MQLFFIRNPRIIWKYIGAVGIILSLSFFPARVLNNAYVTGGFFTRLKHFDSEHPERLLPEVQKLPDKCRTPYSYDGQFYAQIALIFNLDKEIMDQVIDNPTY